MRLAEPEALKTATRKTLDRIRLLATKISALEAGLDLSAWTYAVDKEFVCTTPGEALVAAADRMMREVDP